MVRTDWPAPVRQYAPSLLSAAAAVLLSLPGFGFAYLFDDYNFLGSTQSFRVGLVAPDPDSIFYRPISRELYFGLLNWLFQGSPLGGHIINAILFAGVVLLGAAITKRIAGVRAGIIAGLLLATFGHWPVLVAWVSGAQDLLAIDLALLAIYLELSGRGTGSLIAFGCAVLSKETAVAVAPALVAARWLRSSSLRQALWAGTRVGVLLGAWVLIHPGLHVLLAHGGASPPGSYIGLDNPGRWTALLHSIPTLLNLPLTGFPTPWPKELAWTLGLAGVPLAGALWLMREERDRNDPCANLTLNARGWEIVGFGILLALPPLVLTTLVVQNWAPYYVCFSAVGVSIALSRWLALMPFPRAAVIILLYMVLGMWSRGIELSPGMPTDRTLAPAGNALRRVERNFKAVAPSLPPSSLVYVTTMATGVQSVYIHLHAFQVLRIWYRDPALQTLQPELRVRSASPEFLFCVDPKLNVFQIDVQDLTVRSSGGAVEHRRYRSVLISYAIGLAGVGEVDRAVEILLGIDAPNTWDYVANRRIAAMLALSRGETGLAEDLLRGLPDLPASSSIEFVGELLTVPSRGAHLEENALRAFGLPQDDRKVIRVLLRGLLSLGYYDVSERLAQKLLALEPGDRVATEALAKISSIKSLPGYRIMAPIRTLQFPGE
jgi:hypothetical protein